MKKTVLRGCLALLFAFMLVVGMGDVVARSAENVFAGKVLLLKKRPPSYFKSKQAFIRFIRGNSTKTVYENTEQTWEFEAMSFFRRPLGDYEVQIVFYDISDGRSKDSRRLVDTFPQYTQDRTTRSLSGKIRLIRPAFDAGRRYSIVAQNRGKELAVGEFATRGTSQAQLDNQKRMEAMQKKMEKEMKELERKAREQEKRAKENEKKAVGNLF